MLAYSGTVAIEFDFTITVLSAVIAVLGFWLSLRLLKGPAFKYTLITAVSATLSIAAMHFTGMSAIKAAADVHYDLPPIVVGSIVSILFLLAAFWLVMNASGWPRILLPTVEVYWLSVHFISQRSRPLNWFRTQASL